jgi:fumarylacetoacetate (FAA) hydrolase family protein
MDKFKDKASDMMGSGIGDQLKDINFPASKDEVLRQLEQKGVPSQVLDKVRGADTSQFDSADDLKSKVGL